MRQGNKKERGLLMKKFLALILALALASISFAAFADELPDT